MKRWHEELHIAKRNWNVHRSIVHDRDRPYNVIFTCKCFGKNKQFGRFRKKDAYDCGNTQCWMCHGDKFPKRELTHKEILADLNFKEQLKELDCDSTSI